MSGFREPEQSREQLVLWSTRLGDAIPADHPVRLLDFLLRSESFTPTFRAWEQEYDRLAGRPPYHPRDLAGLFLYGMQNRVRSSRQLEAACYNRLDVIWLMSGQKPDHSTIAAFVSQHEQPLRQLFRDTLAVAVKAGLIPLEHVATDGTKIEADAGRGSVRPEAKIRSWLAHLDQHIAELEEEWRRNERREAGLFGDRAPWAPEREGTLAERMAQMERQQARLRQALQELDRRRAESSGKKAVKAVASTSDPSSRSMRDKEGRTKPNYNAQLTVDAAAGMIVAQAVNDAPEDSGQLTPMLEQVQANCGRKPAAASADSQYNTGPELAKLEEAGIVGYLPDNGTNSDTRPGKPQTAADSSPGEPHAAADSSSGEPHVAPDSSSGEPQAAADSSSGEPQAAADSSSGEPQAAADSSPGEPHAAADSSPGEPQAAASPPPEAARSGIAKERIGKSAFVYDRGSDTYRCPAGHSLVVLGTNRDLKKAGVAVRRQYGFATTAGVPPPCANCAHAAGCCKDRTRGRTINRDQYEEHRERMRERMNSEEGWAVYRRRKETVEPRFGHIKHALGVRRFLRRGLEKVCAEWSLVCTAVNLGILMRHWKEVAPVL